ncbi:MAG: hypothetical protein IPG89_13855 [Bacteroidetes bacterium]|jgi:hypothetical protein|nr:hypothetical protein [Bacteroidota bacterium]
MLKFDRTVSSSGNIKDVRKESEYYSHLTFEKRAEVFAYLQSVAYNYPLGNPPKLDRLIYSKR